MDLLSIVRTTEGGKVTFGVDEAIKLMRRLPVDNPEIVVTVVKATLESINIQVSEIIEDAKQKESEIEGKIKHLNSEIEDLKREIVQREEEIALMQSDLDETTSVKKRFEMVASEQKDASPSMKKDEEIESNEAEPNSLATETSKEQ